MLARIRAGPGKGPRLADLHAAILRYTINRSQVRRLDTDFVTYVVSLHVSSSQRGGRENKDRGRVLEITRTWDSCTGEDDGDGDDEA